MKTHSRRVDARTPGAGALHDHGELLLDNLLVRIHFIIVMIRWTGLAPWEFEFPFLKTGGGMRGLPELAQFTTLERLVSALEPFVAQEGGDLAPAQV